jgi:hypothetical protein
MKIFRMYFTLDCIGNCHDLHFVAVLQDLRGGEGASEFYHDF